MHNLFLIISLIVFTGMVSCSRSDSRNKEKIDAAECLIETNTDSALALLDQLDPSELTEDSVKAKYHYLKAWGHLKRNRSMISDSLITFAYRYYSGKDIVRDTRCATAMAWYKFWAGDTPGAITMLDSLSGFNNVPDSLKIQALRIRVLLGASEYQGIELLPFAKKLVAAETDSIRKLEAQFMLVGAYEYSGQLDSALIFIDNLIDEALNSKLGEKQFIFELERAQILGEMGRNSESDAVIEGIFAKSSPDNGAADYLHMQSAMNALNMGDTQRASRELAMADSMAARLRGDDDTYYRSFSNLMRTLIEFKQTGKMKISHVSGLNNRQRERYNRMKASQWESERGALQQESRALALKAESEHKTVIILVIIIATLLIIAAAAWIIIIRRQQEREKEERIEALQTMVDEYKAAPAPDPQSATSDRPALRRAMLQQLGIIKMVAETPTEQNREMLRKISSIEGETNGELVNWDNLFELIDNLYQGFYTDIVSKYGDLLTAKEEQIIVLMIAGFTTKEISVITGQTTATIYVRKTSIRKKLGVPEKEDIVTCLRNHQTD
ncbi:MAG: LuxR C-terminal-related transcriptional regulator [Muribaculaceae bacterium]|nr:LuxR C-terminal-related transcriptional regulator [Muribaculaceae bacterium]